MTNPAGDAPRWARFVGREARPLEVHEGTFVGPDGRKLNLVAASREALVSVGAQIDEYARQLRPVNPGEIPDDGLLLSAVDHGVRELLTLLEGHDALDVMAMLRQYVMPPDLAMWAESGSTLRDSWAAAEVVALVLLGLGLPPRDPSCDERTAAVIPQLVDTAAVIVQLATIAGVTRWSAREILATADAGLNTLAWRLSSHETTVRGRQYPQVALSINDVVLRTGQTGAVFQDLLGFSYDDVLEVRHAAIEHCGRNHEQAYEHVRAVAEADLAIPLDDATAAAMRAVFETPSQLALVTPSQLAERTHLVVNTVEAILDRFSVQPDGRPPDVLVRQFIDGRNPMAGRAILHAPDRGYLLLPGAIALDEIRRICEAPIKGTKRWTRYGRARDEAVETLVVDTLAALLDSAADVHRNLRYRGPGEGNDLSANSITHQTAPVTEADGLLVLDGVAVCVEVKAGDFRPRTRQGGVAQLDGDLDKTVKDAAAQAHRLRQLIEHHQGLWLENGTWLDLADVDEIHTVVACLDDLGPIALATSELVQAGILTQTHLPWVVSVHDLLVTQHVLSRPEHFLSYLRRRTNRDAALLITGSDELDILMWFVSGGFYFVPDPDRIHAQHPGSKPPTAKMRREYAEQGRTIVGTFTDPLDAHYYWMDGSSSEPADCPRRGEMPPSLMSLSDAMRKQRAPGWWRAAADLDSYSTEAQEGIAESIAHTLAETARDGGFHTCGVGGVDDTGGWLYIFAAGPDTRTNREHLSQYLRAKKHQTHADRALAVLLKADGSLLLTLWLAHEPEDDPDLDMLARAMRLVPPDRAPVAIPPKAKHAARKRRRRKRR